MTEKVTTQTLKRMKADHRPITMVTAYDATFARIVDDAGIDAVLVGDSAGMVIQGHANTLPVTLDHIVYHGQAVARGLQRAHLVLDLPFLTYHLSVQQAVESSGRLIQQGMGESVKLEGGQERVREIEAIVRAQIPVMGHVGLTPQSVHALGGFKVQGRRDAEAQKVLDDAIAVESSGAYAVVLEGIPAELAQEITATLKIPTIGIGAGVHCDGQILVLYDLLGLNGNFRPRFVKSFGDLGAHARRALADYSAEVRSGAFPAEEHSFHRDGARRLKAG